LQQAPPETIVTTPIILETARFALREFDAADRQAFVVCQADPAFARFHTDDERREGHADCVFDLFLRWRLEAPRRNVQLAIARKPDLAGYVGTVGMRSEGLSAGTAEIGIELVPALCNKGSATEIMSAFLAWARDVRGIKALVAETAPGNRAAERLAERAGLRVIREDGKRHWETSLNTG
jgi:RimJ/RimL family protein N-acetyltransferase